MPRSRPLAILLAGTVAVLAAWSILGAVQTAVTEPQSTDYLAFATGSRILQSGSTCIYCQDVQREVQTALLGHAPADRTDFPNLYVNPVPAAELLRPVAALPLDSGLRVFMAGSLVALAAAVLLLARLVPPRRRAAATLVLVVTCASAPAVTALRLAQWDPVLLLAVAAAAVALRRGHPVVAGVLLTALLVKPQLLWMLVPLLAVAGSWRVALGIAAGTAAWLGTSVLLVGPEQLGRWPSLLARPSVGTGARTIGLPGAISAVAGERSSVAVAVVAAGLALGLAHRHRALLRGRAVEVVGLGVALSLACSPHVFPDDLLLLALPLAIVARRRPWRALMLAAALTPAWLIDLRSSAPPALRHVETVVLLCTVLAAAALLRPSADAEGADGAATGERLAVPA